MSDIQTLPQELIDNIVDHLHDDKKSLSSASTISHSWLLSCRFHLFRCIHIKRSRVSPIDDFAQFLETSPSICPIIECLDIKGRLNTTVLFRILSCLDRLTSLKLETQFQSVESEPTTSSFPPIFFGFMCLETSSKG